MEYFSQSESVKNLAASLSKFQGDLEGVSKDSKNPHYKSKYASIDAILSVVNPLLCKHQLSFVCMPYGQDGILCQLLHSSGEFMRSLFVSKIKDELDPQKRGGAITYARRYCMAAWLGISQEDDDGNTASASKPQSAAPQSAVAPIPAAPSTYPNGMTHDQVEAIKNIQFKYKIPYEKITQFLKSKFNVEKSSELTKEQAQEMITYLWKGAKDE